MQFPTLAKDQVRRPIVPVRLLGPNRRWSTIDALIDTGSDITLFPERLAERVARPDHREGRGECRIVEDVI